MAECRRLRLQMASTQCTGAVRARARVSHDASSISAAAASMNRYRRFRQMPQIPRTGTALIGSWMRSTLSNLPTAPTETAA